ncbi:MAG: hypothetical protein AB7O96_13000 [Pseudobdellovibrionaceae bacterium]
MHHNSFLNLKKTLIIVTGLTVSFPAFSKNSWNWGLSSNQEISESTQSQTMSFSGQGTLNYNLTEYFDLAAQGGIYMQTGSRHSTVDPERSGNGFNFSYAQFNLRPFSFLEFSAGALNQEMHSNSLLISPRAFPAGQVSLLSPQQNEDLTLRAYYQSAVPTSAQFDSETSDREPLPSLHVGGIKTKFQNGSSFDPDLIVSTTVGRWKFMDLPTKVAADSVALGNTVLQSTPGLAKFAYQFEGLTASFDTQFRIYRNLKGFFGIRGHRNEKAPTGANEGRTASAGIQYTTIKQVTLRPEYTIFQNQSDSSPGYYNSSYMGNNNKKGEIFGLRLDFKKSDFALFSEYAKLKEIFNNPAQEESQSLMFYLEIRNASI